MTSLIMVTAGARVTAWLPDEQGGTRGPLQAVGTNDFQCETAACSFSFCSICDRHLWGPVWALAHCLARGRPLGVTGARLNMSKHARPWLSRP